MSTGDLRACTKRRWRWPCAGALTVLALSLLSPDLVTAQDAELYGVVTDQSGAVVPGATVTVMLQIRAQAHNVFNHRNVSQPDTSIGTVIGATGQFVPAPLFGRVTQTFGGGGGFGSAVSIGGARTVQLALRVTF